MPISGLRHEIGKKSPKNRFWPHPENRERIAQKLEKWPENPIFEPFFLFLDDFFPIFRVRPKMIFRRFSSDFRRILPGTHTCNTKHNYSNLVLTPNGLISPPFCIYLSSQLLFGVLICSFKLKCCSYLFMEALIFFRIRKQELKQLRDLGLKNS